MVVGLFKSKIRALYFVKDVKTDTILCLKLRNKLPQIQVGTWFPLHNISILKLFSIATVTSRSILEGPVLDNSCHFNTES
jgi:hypothetical protein